MELPMLRTARLQAGLSQRDLAARAGLTQRTIVKLEAGTPARPSTARKLAQALGLNIAALAGQAPIGTGGRPGDPVYVLVAGKPGDPDARWERVSPEETEDGGNDR